MTPEQQEAVSACVELVYDGLPRGEHQAVFGSALVHLLASVEGRVLLREALGDEHAGWQAKNGVLVARNAGITDATALEYGCRRVWVEREPR